MRHLLIEGGKPLSGTVRPSGNKNAALPAICATLLTSAPCTLRNVPDITDVHKLVGFLRELGSDIIWDVAAGIMRLDHSGLAGEQGEAELPAGMRSSLLLLPGLLHRWGRLRLASNVKGCALGVREVDPHLEILTAFGAEYARGQVLQIWQRERPRGTELWQDYMSVTATGNFLMSAVLAHGTARLVNAASEPHVQDLGAMLTAMGARITGAGTSTLAVEGVEALQGVDFTLATDHHEVATFLALGAITGGEIRVENAVPQHMTLIRRAFSRLGAEVAYEGDVAVVERQANLATNVPFTQNLLPKIEAAPWPYFPVDLLPLMIAVATRSQGQVMFWNKVYEGGFFWVAELTKFGAHVLLCDPHRALVFGGRTLRPATVEAPYIIRAAVALFMVAASVEGRSVVRQAAPIRRAHPRFVENLHALGAEVRWIDD